MLSVLLFLVGAGGGMLSQSAVGEPPADISITAVRFYRAEQNQTRVSAFIEIPYAMLQPAGRGDSARMVYEATVTVKDTTGLQLLRESWRNRAPAFAKVPGASALEIFDFAVVPGTYRLEVTLTDSVSGRQATAVRQIQGFPGAPVASDLLLAPSMRVAGTSDTVPGRGEIRRGNTLIAAAAQLRLTPLRSDAFYMLEAYADSQATGKLTVEVVDSSGNRLLKTPPLTVSVSPGGSLLQGKVPLAGLPPGRYSLTASVDVDGRTVERTAPLVMAPLEQTLERAVARDEQARVSDEGYFAALPEDSLDAAEDPLDYVAKSGELKVYDDELSPAAKRKFLADFWARRDPTPGTPRNEARERFYGAIEYANKEFQQPGRMTTPGWKTDRGRVFIKYGAPTDMLRRVAQGNAPPYQVWRYQQGKDRYYVFADRTSLGEYDLILTNDLSETTLPGWQRLLGAPQVDDVGRFLGITFTQRDDER